MLDEPVALRGYGIICGMKRKTPDGMINWERLANECYYNSTICNWFEIAICNWFEIA